MMERADEEKAKELARLRQAWQKGIDGGGADELNLEALKAAGRARLAALKVAVGGDTIPWFDAPQGSRKL